MAVLLDLPNELVVKIVSGLTHRDLIACQLSNKQLYTIIKDSVLLQFQIALSTYKATDNPSCSLSLSERFKALKDSEDAWSYLRKDFTGMVTINKEMAIIYDLTGGVLVLGNGAGTAVHHVRPPSSIVSDNEWKKIELDDNVGKALNMRLCLHEHDLLVVVTSKPRNDESEITTYDIRLVFFKLSTGAPHPAAQESTILVLNSEWERPDICVDIVGDRLVLIVNYPDEEWMPEDRVLIYDWRNAVQKMSFAVPHCSYSRFVFLSENLVIIPNARTNTLEIWDIFSTPETPRPACILQLPELAIGNTLSKITCHGEPNPIGSQSRPQSDKPFHQSAHEAIMLFRIRVRLGEPAGYQQQYHWYRDTYLLFVHRQALCEVYQQHCGHLNNKPGDSLGIPEISGQLESLGFEDTGLDETIVDDDVCDSWDSDSEDDIYLRDTRYDPIPIPWSSWGPPITRLLPEDNNATDWLPTTSGQRGVLSTRDTEPGSRFGGYDVLDFNPENVRRMEKMLETLRFGIHSQISCYRDAGGVGIKGMFKDPVVGELPFVRCSYDGSTYEWGGVLIDEESVHGLRIQDGYMGWFEVHHFG